MPTINELATLCPKWELYDNYFALVCHPTEYELITRRQMLKEIVEEYSHEDRSLYNLCTARELKFLKLRYNNPTTPIDKTKYHWEITQLSDKYIIDYGTAEIYDEQLSNVKLALQKFSARPQKGEDEIITFALGFLRANAEIPEKTLITLIADFSTVTPENIELLFAHPLFRFYTGERYCDVRRSFLYGQKILHYRGYDESSLDDILNLRKEHQVAPSPQEFRFEDYFDMFYYGMPLRKQAVKKLHTAISHLPF